MTNKALKEVLGLNDPDSMFDMVVVAAYVAGQARANIPVDDCREIFEKIKLLVKE